MRRFVLLALAAGCAVPMAAHAEFRTIGARGLWSAFEGSGPDQTPLCGISTGGPDGRQISVIQYAGETSLLIAFDKAGWAIPDGTLIPVRVTIDGVAQPDLEGHGRDRRVGVTLAFAPSIGFMRALRGGTQIRVDFPSGNEPFWSGGLAGTGAAINAFNDCRGRFAAAPTQPFATTAAPAAIAPPSGAPTQPFAVPPPQASSPPAAAPPPEPQTAPPLPPIPAAPKP